MRKHYCIWEWAYKWQGRNINYVQQPQAERQAVQNNKHYYPKIIGRKWEKKWKTTEFTKRLIIICLRNFVETEMF